MMMQAIGADPHASADFGRHALNVWKRCVLNGSIGPIPFSREACELLRQFCSHSSFIQAGIARAADSAPESSAGSDLRLTILRQGTGAPESGTGNGRQVSGRRCARIANRFPKPGAVDAGGAALRCAHRFAHLADWKKRKGSLKFASSKWSRRGIISMRWQRKPRPFPGSRHRARIRPAPSWTPFWRALNLRTSSSRTGGKRFARASTKYCFNALVRIFAASAVRNLSGTFCCGLAFARRPSLLPTGFSALVSRRQRGGNGFAGRGRPLAVLAGVGLRRARSGRARRLPHGRFIAPTGRASRACRTSARWPRTAQKLRANIFERLTQVQTGPPGDACDAAAGALPAHFAA